MTRSKILPVLALILASAIAASAATIPHGTVATVRTGSTLDSGKVHSGDHFTGTLVNDIKSGNTTVAKAGSNVEGIVILAKDSGRLHAPGELKIGLTSINGIPVKTSSHFYKGKSHTKSNVIKIGGGTAAGALIGGLAGGGKGAAIGAGVGAAAGTGVAAATGKEQAVVPAETTISFTVQ